MSKITAKTWLLVFQDAGAPLNLAQCLMLYEMNLCKE